ncbi:MAG: patatin-like phospholipase family protein [Geminicoccaceae bacterium]
MNNGFEFKEEDWGHLASRYKEARPRKLLALDGGGMRGVITLRVLQRLETLLEMPLCDYFDYIAGTSTGAIIAACLAMGMKVEEIERFYLDFGRQVFKKRWLPRRWVASYSAEPLEARTRELLCEIADTNDNPDLRPQFLRCLFMAVTRNASTDSVWPISSNPAALFNDPREADCNLRIPMWEILRASSAAPTFFPPHSIVLDHRNPRNAFAFVDGGTTPYNNPAFLLYRMATMDKYHLRWPKGEDKLLLVSIGTGTSPAAEQPVARPGLGLIRNVEATINALMHQAAIDQDTNCRMVGRCMNGHDLDYEIGDLILRDSAGRKIPATIDTGRDFLYLRYNTILKKKRGLDELGLDDIVISEVERLDAVSPKAIEQLQKIGNALADKIDLADFGAFAPSL